MTTWVLQRNRRGVSEARLSGTAEADGPVEARVTRGRRVVSGWKKMGAAYKGQFAATLRGVATGGLYEMVVPGASQPQTGTLESRCSSMLSEMIEGRSNAPDTSETSVARKAANRENAAISSRS